MGEIRFLTFKSYGDKVVLTDFNGVQTVKRGNPLDILSEYSEKYKSPIIEGLPEFSGGAVGCFSYDLVRLSENLPNVPEDDLEQPDMHFMFTDEIIAFDNKKKKLVLMVNIHPGDNLKFRYDRAVERLMEIRNELNSPLPELNEPKNGFRGALSLKATLLNQSFAIALKKRKSI